MKTYDKLQISFEPSIATYDSITELLGKNPSGIKDSNAPIAIPTTWSYEVTSTELDSYFDFINTFLDILDAKYETLYKLGINRKDITIWCFYEYDQQCNLEFDPVRMKRLGDNGITLCITCWDSGKKYQDSKIEKTDQA